MPILLVAPITHEICWACDVLFKDFPDLDHAL